MNRFRTDTSERRKQKLDQALQAKAFCGQMFFYNDLLFLEKESNKLAKHLNAMVKWFANDDFMEIHIQQKCSWSFLS